MDKNIIIIIFLIFLYLSILMILFKKNKNNKMIKYLNIFLLSMVSVFLFYIIFSGNKGFYKSSKSSSKPKRLVVSLSTLPSRVNNIKPVLKSILKNTLKPDLIYLNIPKFSMREKVEYKINPKNVEFDPKIIVNRIDTDYGPITKLYPVLEKETDPDTVIICIDDDIIYDKNLIQTLYDQSVQNPESCICSRGWSYINLGKTFIPVFFPLYFVKKVKILQCFAGVLYKRSFFENIQKFKKFMNVKECFTTDDIIISKFLESEAIGILSIPIKYSKMYMDIQNVNTLSAFNDNNNTRLKCINYDFSKI